MASITFSDTGTAYNTDANWVGGTKPGLLDTAIFDANSGDCTLSGTAATPAALTMTDYTGTFTIGKEIDVGGAAIFGGTIVGEPLIIFDINVEGDITAVTGTNFSNYSGQIIFDGGDAKTLTANADLPELEINAVGGLTAASTVTCKSFTLTAGAYNDGASDHNIGGTIVINDTFTNAATWTMTSSGNLINNETAFTDLVISDNVDAVLIGQTKFLALTTAATASITTSTDKPLYTNGDNHVDGWWSGVDPETDIEVQLIVWKSDTAKSPGAAINLNDSELLIYTSQAADVLTMDADINIGSGALNIRGLTNGDGQTLDMAGYNLVCSDVTLGTVTDTTGFGRLILEAGYHKVGNITGGHVSNSDLNGIDFGTGSLTVTGKIDGTLLHSDFTSDTSSIVYGGIISDLNCALSGLNVIGATDGGGNTNITFDDYDANPAIGTLSTTGAGA